MNTSAQALEVVKPKIPSIKERILDAVELAGAHGLQREELIRITGIHDNSISGRISELKDAGKLRVDGTRTNARGNPEDVYKIGDGVPVARNKGPTVIRPERLAVILKSLGVTQGQIMALNWSNQPEGTEYWNDIYDMLRV